MKKRTDKSIDMEILKNIMTGAELAMEVQKAEQGRMFGMNLNRAKKRIKKLSGEKLYKFMFPEDGLKEATDTAIITLASRKFSEFVKLTGNIENSILATLEELKKVYPQIVHMKMVNEGDSKKIIIYEKT